MNPHGHLDKEKGNNVKFDALEYFVRNNMSKLNSPNPVKATTTSALDYSSSYLFGKTFNELTNDDKIKVFASI